MNSILKAKLKLIAITLICYTAPSNADYFDILHSGSHSLAVLSCSHNICVQSTKSDKSYSYGVGLGYNLNWFRLVLLTSKEHAIDDDYNVEFKAYYHDKKISYFAGIKREFSSRKTSAEVGVGYPINGKFSVIIKHSYGVASIGIRRYF